MIFLALGTGFLRRHVAPLQDKLCDYSLLGSLDGFLLGRNNFFLLDLVLHSLGNLSLLGRHFIRIVFALLECGQFRLEHFH